MQLVFKVLKYRTVKAGLTFCKLSPAEMDFHIEWDYLKLTSMQHVAASR